MKIKISHISFVLITAIIVSGCCKDIYTTKTNNEPVQPPKEKFWKHKHSRVEIVSINVKRSSDFTFFQNPETRIYLEVEAENKIFELSKKSRILSVTDNKGYNLFAKSNVWRKTQAPMNNFARTTIDFDNVQIHNDRVLLPIILSSAPYKGATYITIDARIVFLCYPDAKIANIIESKFIDFDKIETKIKFDKYFIDLQQSGYATIGDKQFHSYSLTTNVPLFQIIFFDSKNKPVQTLSGDNLKNFDIQDEQLRKIKRAKIFYGPPKLEIVPVKITTGIGV